MATLALAGLVSAGCSAAPAPDPTSTPVPTSSRPSTDGPAPASSLDDFYGQAVDFAPCQVPVPTAGDGVAVDGTCGTVEVPLDYSDPSGDTAQIAVFRIPARGAEPVGSLVVNPGGPGYGGVGYAASSALSLTDDPVTENFDLVGFDPRGTGASVPTIDCFSDAERDADAVVASEMTRPASRPLVKACADSVGGVDALAHMGTVDVVRDLDVLRAVLGDEKLSFAGVSYGSRLGAAYAQTFPENVRSLVLDGAMDPAQGSSARRLDQWASLQGAFDDLAVFCVEQGGCPLGDDAAEATGAYQELVRPLLETPATTVQGRGLTFEAANDALVAALYSQASWPAVITGLTELTRGRGDTLLALRDVYHGRSPDGSYADEMEATVVINCLDEARFSGREQEQLVRSLRAAAPIFDPGTPVEGGPDWCDGWPVGPTLDYPYASAGGGQLPTPLVVATTGDALSPYVNGTRLADALGGHLLTVEGNQHGVVMTGVGCVDDAVAAYLLDQVLPTGDEPCRL